VFHCVPLHFNHWSRAVSVCMCVNQGEPNKRMRLVVLHGICKRNPENFPDISPVKIPPDASCVFKFKSTCSRSRYYFSGVCMCMCLGAFASLSLLGPTCVLDVLYQDLSPYWDPLRPNRVFH